MYFWTNRETFALKIKHFPQTEKGKFDIQKK